jgi:hypothetical protein
MTLRSVVAAGPCLPGHDKPLTTQNREIPDTIRMEDSVRYRAGRNQCRQRSGGVLFPTETGSADGSVGTCRRQLKTAASHAVHHVESGPYCG